MEEAEVESRVLAHFLRQQVRAAQSSSTEGQVVIHANVAVIHANGAVGHANATIDPSQQCSTARFSSFRVNVHLHSSLLY